MLSAIVDAQHSYSNETIKMEDDGEIFKILTANRLRDGAIVYFQIKDGQPDWVTDIATATAFDEQAIDGATEIAQQSVTDCTVLGLYPIEVAGRNRPLSAKEIVRSKGPSIKYGHAAIAPDFSI